MVELGVILGLAGIATGALSLLYSRAQASASKGQAEEARRQAVQATHMTLLAANHELFERLQNTQDRLGKSPVLRELQEAVPDLQAIIVKVGAWDDYIMLRKVCAVFQDAYFMRRNGIVTEGYWRELAGIAAIWSKAPSFRAVFEYSVQRRLVHDEFVASFQPVVDGQVWLDPNPATTKRAGAATPRAPEAPGAV